MIETTKHIIIIFTNYFVNIFIVKQITFANININKFNLRLARASIYLSQFRFDINLIKNTLYLTFYHVYRQITTSLFNLIQKTFSILTFIMMTL